jgi:hypothetical protein
MPWPRQMLGLLGEMETPPVEGGTGMLKSELFGRQEPAPVPAGTAEGIAVRASPDAEGVGGAWDEGTAKGELDLGGGGGAGRRAANTRRPRNIRSPRRRCKLKVAPIRSDGIAPHRAVKIHDYRGRSALIVKGYGLRWGGRLHPDGVAVGILAFDGAGVVLYGNGEVIGAGGSGRPAELARSISGAVTCNSPGGSCGKAGGRQNRYILVIRITEVDSEAEVLIDAGDVSVGAGVVGVIRLCEEGTVDGAGLGGIAGCSFALGFAYRVDTRRFSCRLGTPL